MSIFLYINLKNTNFQWALVNLYAAINTPYQVSSYLTFRSVFLNLADYQKQPGL